MWILGHTTRAVLGEGAGARQGGGRKEEMQEGGRRPWSRGPAIPSPILELGMDQRGGSRPRILFQEEG